MADVEFRHLLSFRAVAQSGSFHEAAEMLEYTQSAVSQHVATLEGLLGVRLLDRSRGRRTVQLTEAGTLLLRHVESIVARMQAARADL
ncbi:MAG: LysR family transcriptional regulator, partial [Candidatus Limnocylindrales bacterium]